MRRRTHRSILDWVSSEVAELKRELGAVDRHRSVALRIHEGLRRLHLRRRSRSCIVLCHRLERAVEEPRQ